MKMTFDLATRSFRPSESNFIAPRAIAEAKKYGMWVSVYRPTGDDNEVAVFTPCLPGAQAFVPFGVAEVTILYYPPETFS